jgi:hypothetical protein
MIVMEVYWTKHGYPVPPPGAALVIRMTMMEDWLDRNWRIYRQYGPGPTMEHLLARKPKPPARDERDMDEIEEEIAKDGYQIPPPGTPLKERFRLFKQWIERRRAGGSQDHSPGSSIGNPYAGRGGGGSSGYQHFGPRPSIGPLGYQQYGPGPFIGSTFGLL